MDKNISKTCNSQIHSKTFSLDESKLISWSTGKAAETPKKGRLVGKIKIMLFHS